MGNPQHLEWLMEGVESWNARRQRDEFVPDFSGVDLTQDLLRAEKFSKDRSRVPQGPDLRDANFSGADLRDAVLLAATLRGTNLQGANLQGTNLAEADLNAVNLRGAVLNGAVLTDSTLGGADLRSNHPGPAKAKISKVQFTDLRKCLGLKQRLLNGALGDTSVLLPDGLVHPDHWPDFEALDHSTDALSGLPAMERQVTEATIEGLMAHAALHKVHARATAETIRAVIGGSLAAGTNDLPRVLRITASIADVLDFTSDAFERDAKALRARVEDLETQVAALNVALRDAEARAAAEASLAAGLRSQIDAGQDGFWTSFAKTNGEQAAKLPYFMAKIGVVYYVATLLGPNHPLVKLLFDTLNAFKA